MSFVPGDDGGSPRPPIHTPLPLGRDYRIDELAEEMVECRPDLNDKERHMLSRQLAYRCRSFRRGSIKLEPEAI